MIRAAVGTIDAYVVRRGVHGLEVLVMRRATGMRCAGAWEVVHGRIEAGERPEDAAMREVREETGLEVERLYSIRCIAFYVQREARVNIAPVFAAFAAQPAPLILGEEHAEGEWLPIAEAAERLAWPSARDALRDIQQLVGTGDAGPLEDVLRVR
ncbi:MAG: NUDIX domain-containing protein [Gemmatimonadaceae bacterium]